MSLKVLHLALVAPDNNGAIDLGFTERGHEVRRVDWVASTDPNREAVSHIGWADVVLYQGQGGGKIASATLDDLRAAGAYVVSWTGDVRDHVEWYKKMAPSVDLTLFTNGTDIDLMREAGFKADYLQVGYDDRLFSLGDPQDRSGIVFMGHHYGGRFPQTEFRYKTVERLREEFGNRFTAYGSNYPKAWGYRPCNYIEEAQIYRRSLLAIGVDHYLRPYFASDRLLRSQACGACVLQQRYEGGPEEHSGVVFWDNLDMLVTQCRELLDHPEQAQAMGRHNAEHVLNDCRWSNRIERFEQLIEQYK